MFNVKLNFDFKPRDNMTLGGHVKIKTRDIYNGRG